MEAGHSITWKGIFQMDPIFPDLEIPRQILQAENEDPNKHSS
jgi:hypothetical protein